VLDLLHTSSAWVGTARHWAADRLADVPVHDLDDILLVINELVSNAYEHGGGAVQLRLDRLPFPSRITIEVDDMSLLTPTPGSSRLGPEHHRGRGLVLVSRLATEWGVRSYSEAGGKTVWACCTLATS
jgi:anti-sigma regulatory factor (Ser/Thr protein kinase)